MFIERIRSFKLLLERKYQVVRMAIVRPMELHKVTK